MPSVNERVRDRVSFVIPTHNNERTIKACVTSAAAQSGDIEVIVVDNQSSDATPELASGSGADRVLIAGPERSAQRNRGFEASTGEIVVFIDSDMVVEDRVAPNLRAAFRDVSVGAAVLPETAFGLGYLAQCRALEKRLYLGVASAEAARAFRASILAEIGGYDEAYFGFEDYELADRVQAAGWALGRSHAGVRHDEGRVQLRALWHKKRYYGSQWRLSSTQQIENGRLRRFPFRPGVLLSDAVHVPGLVLLKIVDLTGLTAGHLGARRGRPDGLSNVASDKPAAT